MERDLYTVGVVVRDLREHKLGMKTWDGGWWNLWFWKAIIG